MEKKYDKVTSIIVYIKNKSETNQLSHYIQVSNCSTMKVRNVYIAEVRAFKLPGIPCFTI